MVRIVNGEIIQDNDPRLKNMTNKNGVSRRGVGQSGGINDLFSSNSNATTPQTPNNPTYGQGINQQSQSQSQSQPQQQHQNPLELLARYLKIEDNVITIPPISALGFTESKVGLIYFLALGLLCLIFGIRALLFGLLAYGFYKSSEKK